jgi:lipoate---protein ligase
MYCITLESDDPFFNLAIEEVLLKNSSEEYFILGINRPSLIIGKHQSAHREANTRFITENIIPVIRRISGGGTVFQDKGNLNFTLIRNSEEGHQVDFRKYTLPVIQFLSSIGIDATLGAKNSLQVDGLKISGNAEHVHRNRVLHHGTLLFSVSLEILSNSIRNNKSCYITRAVESNPASILNLNAKLGRLNDISEFRNEMMNYILNYFPDTETYNLSSSETKEAEILANTKYKTWEWNWAYGPEYTFNNIFSLNGNQTSCQLFVKDGIIIGCSVEQDSKKSPISEKLIGCRHMVGDLLKILLDDDFIRSKEDIYNFF